MERQRPDSRETSGAPERAGDASLNDAETPKPEAETQPGAATPVSRGRRARTGLLLVLSFLFLGVVAAGAFLVITHRAVAVPQWIVARIETRANDALQGQMRVRLSGGIDLYIDDGIRPRIRLNTVRLERPSGLPIAVLPELRMTLWAEPLLRGRVEPRSFRLRGASLSLHRLPDGNLDLDFGGGNRFANIDLNNASDLIETFEKTLEVPALSRLQQISAEDLQIRLMDERLDRLWKVTDGRFKLTQSDSEISVALGFDLGSGQTKPAQVALSMTTQKASREASFGAAVTALPARDLAVQAPALAALGVLDAPISGALRSGLNDKGELTGMNAMLEIGRGAIRPNEGVNPIPIENGKLYLNYDPKRQRVEVSTLSLNSRALRLKAAGHTYLRDLEGGVPQKIVGQIAISDLQLDPAGLFESPVQFAQGAVDFRLNLDPFRIDIGQLELNDQGDTTISARGKVSAEKDGWKVALDAGIDQIDQTKLLALWPPAVVPKTREWLEKNVTTGQLRNARVALRLVPGAQPKLALGYEFRGADVRIIKTLPPVQQGRGFATIIDTRQALKVEEGHVTAPSGGRIEVTGSSLIVPDIRIKPAPAKVTLMTRSPIPAALSLLDQPPFEFLSKAGMSTDVAQGWAEARSVIRLPLKPNVPQDEIDFDVTARLTEVKSDTLVPDRPLRSDLLTLKADPQGMTISGKGTLSGVGFDAAWTQKFGPENKGRSEVAGTVDVSPDGLDRLGIALPNGMVRGSGKGRIALELRKDQPTRFTFASALQGIRLSIPEIGWSKAPGSAGDLKMSGTLGAPPQVDSLSLSAAGLKTQGDITLNKGGGLNRARFSSLSVGNWFTGSVDLIGQGKARPPKVNVTSGRLDLAKADLGGGAGASAGGAGTAISAALDRVQITDGIALTGFRGDFNTRGGLSGRFQGQLNGSAPIDGTVIPAAGGRVAVRAQTRDAGRALAATGIFTKARGGQGALVLTPLGQKSYDGKLTVANLRVKDAPVLASLLSAASGVGLLEQLSGDGILFSSVDGAFRLTPNGVSVTRGAAVGASMGVTMTGNYYPQSKTLNMKGVISPFYLVNGIGQVISKQGEGLFGFNYSLRGSSDAPKVSINPLSVLAPGGLRELFRAGPPKVLSE
ncbi:AsmA-like C-terminal region-containing protein [Thioclava sp. F28-4]|uniref:YhdP family protein n=1 Tax=Thioclava sp. F28-4 TaxID=1915315 RepID=UPI0011BA8116|nr:AsmA-like C-terminal region-containing protein [Thioclava sp. F28-4]